jgi:hypothetical protein
LGSTGPRPPSPTKSRGSLSTTSPTRQSPNTRQNTSCSVSAAYISAEGTLVGVELNRGLE